MELAVERKWFSPKAALGEWRLPSDEFIGFSLEDPPRTGPDNVLQPEEKIPGRTAIPTGRYRLILDWSEKFKQVMPHLVDVPGYEGVRVHIINKPEDTEGCIGIGMTRSPDFIGSALIAYGRICRIICDAITRGEQVFVTVRGGPPENFWKEAA